MSDFLPTRMVFRSTGKSRGLEGIGAGVMLNARYALSSFRLRWPRYVLVLVLRGEGRYADADNREYPLTPGCIFQRLPDIPHSSILDPRGNWCECYIECGPVLFESLREYALVKTSRPVWKCGNPVRLRKLIEDFVPQLDSATPEKMPLMLSILADILLVANSEIVMEPRRRMDMLISNACRLLVADFKKPFDIKKFCVNNGVGYESFRKYFTAICGVPPIRYRSKYRLDIATTLLNNSSRTISDIAEELGFSSEYEFSHRFKKAFNVTPSIFRKGRRETAGNTSVGASPRKGK